MELDLITSIAIVVAVLNILFVIWLFTELIRSQRINIYAGLNTESPGIVLAMTTLLILTFILIIAVLLE